MSPRPRLRLQIRNPQSAIRNPQSSSGRAVNDSI
jgi:hypothetical protein